MKKILPTKNWHENFPIYSINFIGCYLTFCKIPFSSNGTLRSDTSDICAQVVFPDNVNYTVDISVDRSFCERNDKNSTFLSQILFIGYGAVDIEIVVNCDCDCGPQVCVHVRTSCQGDTE